MYKIQFLCVLLMPALCLIAQEDTISVRQMNEIVITANKFPQKQSATGKLITVITQEQLQKNPGRNIGEILNEQAGLAIGGAANTPGTNLTLFTRGAAFANTLILIDGIPLNDPSTINSEFDLNTFPVYQIERIEILKGAQSTLYGSDAVAGVVNIITKSKGKKGLNGHADFSTGSFGTYQGNLAINGENDDASYHLSYSKIKSRGFSAAYDSSRKSGFDRDGFNQDLVQANFTRKVSSSLQLRVFGKYSFHRADIDAGPFADDKDYRYTYLNLQAGTGATYHYKMGALTINYHYNFVDRRFIDDSVSVGGFSIYQKGLYKGMQHFAEAYNSLQISPHLDWLAGFEFRQNATEQNYFSVSAFGPYETLPLSPDTARTSQYSAYTSFYLKQAGGFSAELGGRWNNSSIYGNNFTGSFNPSLLINDRLKFFVNVATAYRVPSLYQLYSEFGNRALKPETSVNYEAGIQYASGGLNARISAFKRDIRDVFAFYTDFTTYQSFYVNEDKQRDHGMEAEASVRCFGKLNLSANYSYANGKITTALSSGKDTSYNNLYRRPKHSFNAHAGMQLNRHWYASTHLRAVSEFYEPVYAAAPIKMQGYYTLDIFSEYQVGKALKVFTGFYNITNQHYFESLGFSSKAFNWTAGLKLDF